MAIAISRRNSWIILITVTLTCWFLPTFIRLHLIHNTGLFIALRLIIPFAAYPALRSLWPNRPRTAFLIFYTFVNFTLLIAFGFGSLWALACAFHNGPCH